MDSSISLLFLSWECQSKNDHVLSLDIYNFYQELSINPIDQ